MIGGLDGCTAEVTVADKGPVREKSLVIVMVSVGSMESCRLGIFGLDEALRIAPLPPAPNPLGNPSPNPTGGPPAAVGTDASGSNPSSAGLAKRLSPLNDPLFEINLGFLPLSNTFFRALALTQTIICLSASRSLTVRPGLRAVPVRGVKPIGRGIVDWA